jgi:DNA polymerase I-like protein with 3'-5' exonuclease and polymerase domains
VYPYPTLSGHGIWSEAIGVAANSKDWVYREKLLAGLDTHTELALHFWGSLPDDPNERSLFRDIAKTIKYASSYVAKVKTVTTNLNKESDRLGRYFREDEVAGYLQKLYQMHPLQEWWATIRRELNEKNGILRNCFGYRRVFRDPEVDNRVKDAANFYPQSTVAWLMNDSLPKLFRRLDKPGVRELLHQVHDEALWHCRPEEVSTIIKVSKEIMEQRFVINGHELYIPIDFKMGKNWGSGMKGVK